MTLTPYTPGPWTAEEGNPDLFRPGTLIVHNGMRVFAQLEDIAPEDADSTKANFQLMAAAPELLDALSVLLYAYRLDREWLNEGEDAASLMARAAIAKAEGR